MTDFMKIQLNYLKYCLRIVRLPHYPIRALNTIHIFV